MEFERETSVGYVVNHLARLMARHLAGAIAPLGISPGQFPVLLALWDRDGQTQRALVEATSVEQATMANTLNRMERDGLIRREADPRDKRAQRVYLTDKARAIEDDAKAAAEAVNRAACKGLYSAERDRLVTLMQKLAANLAEQG